MATLHVPVSTSFLSASISTPWAQSDRLCLAVRSSRAGRICRSDFKKENNRTTTKPKAIVPTSNFISLTLWLLFSRKSWLLLPSYFVTSAWTWSNIHADTSPSRTPVLLTMSFTLIKLHIGKILKQIQKVPVPQIADVYCIKSPLLSQKWYAFHRILIFNMFFYIREFLKISNFSNEAVWNTLQNKTRFSYSSKCLDF